MTATSEMTEAKIEVATLKVAAFPGIDTGRTTSLLEKISPPANPVEIEQITQVLAETQDAGIVILYSRPEQDLLRAMSAGRSPSEALNTWQKAAKQSLLAWRHNRKRVLLAHGETILQDSAAFLESLRARLGIHVDLKGESSAQENHQTFEELHRLIAVQMVAQSSEVQDLLAELEAASVLTEVNHLLPVNCESIFQDMNGKSVLLADEHEALQTRCKDHEVENELLLLQLHQVQEELEHYFKQVQDQTGKLKKLENERGRIAKEKIAARNAANRNERALKAARKENRQLQGEVKKLRLKITAINRSTSWRLTKPLRFIGRLFKRSKPAVSKT